MKLRMAAASLLGSAVLATAGVGIAAAQPGGPGGGQLAAQRATNPQIRHDAQTIASE